MLAFCPSVLYSQYGPKAVPCVAATAIYINFSRFNVLLNIPPPPPIVKAGSTFYFALFGLSSVVLFIAFVSGIIDRDCTGT